MNSHEHPGVRRPCAASLATLCNTRPAGRRRRQPASLTRPVPLSPGHPRARCEALRTPPGYLADLGGCWYRRYPWSPASWRLNGPHN
jgi:hypothetical protein